MIDSFRCPHILLLNTSSYTPSFLWAMEIARQCNEVVNILSFLSRLVSAMFSTSALSLTNPIENVEKQLFLTGRYIKAGNSMELAWALHCWPLLHLTGVNGYPWALHCWRLLHLAGVNGYPFSAALVRNQVSLDSLILTQKRCVSTLSYSLLRELELTLYSIARSALFCL